MNDDKKSLILIADDNPLNIKILENMLKRKGYQTALAENGHKALEFLQNQQPDIILLDIMMPAMDGYEVCRRLRKEEVLASTKIIYLSIKGQLPDRLAGYEAGADDFIVKPVDPEELLAKIKVYVKIIEETANDASES